MIAAAGTVPAVLLARASFKRRYAQSPANPTPQKAPSQSFLRIFDSRRVARVGAPAINPGFSKLSSPIDFQR
jgi:hypothetical protein